MPSSWILLSDIFGQGDIPMANVYGVWTINPRTFTPLGQVPPDNSPLSTPLLLSVDGHLIAWVSRFFTEVVVALALLWRCFEYNRPASNFQTSYVLRHERTGLSVLSKCEQLLCPIRARSYLQTATRLLNFLLVNSCRNRHRQPVTGAWWPGNACRPRRWRGDN